MAIKTATPIGLSLFGLLVAGCGLGLPSASVSCECGQLGYDDPATDVIFESALADRYAGFSESDAILSALTSCNTEMGVAPCLAQLISSEIEFGPCLPGPNGNGPSFITVQTCTDGCITCATAIVREVYGGF